MSSEERFPRLAGGAGSMWLADSDRLSPPSSRFWCSEGWKAHQKTVSRRFVGKSPHCHMTAEERGLSWAWPRVDAEQTYHCSRAINVKPAQSTQRSIYSLYLGWGSICPVSRSRLQGKQLEQLFMSRTDWTERAKQDNYTIFHIISCLVYIFYFMLFYVCSLL